MTRHERTGWRDEAFSSWHRSLEPPDENRLTAIDLDWVEYCGRCWEPLAILELCADIGRTEKEYAVTRRIAKRLGVPAWCVLYAATADGQSLVRVRVKKIAPKEGEWGFASPAALERLVRRIHERCPHCGAGVPSGRRAGGHQRRHVPASCAARRSPGA